MRQVVLDTETTGLEASAGHRLIEIGCVEVINRRLSGRTYHQYLNPEREIDAGAQAVHGITGEFLRDKPRFAAIVDEFMAFIQDAELIIHNAPFDVGFINHELQRLNTGWQRLNQYCTVTDTLQMARHRHPGQKNNLDALCKRYEVNNSHRSLHGALLDAEILADVYLAMTGGQVGLSLESSAVQQRQQLGIRPVAAQPLNLPRIQPNEAELAAHQQRLNTIEKASGGQCLWLHHTPVD